MYEEIKQELAECRQQTFDSLLDALSEGDYQRYQCLLSEYANRYSLYYEYIPPKEGSAESKEIEGSIPSQPMIEPTDGHTVKRVYKELNPIEPFKGKAKANTIFTSLDKLRRAFRD